MSLFCYLSEIYIYNPKDMERKQRQIPLKAKELDKKLVRWKEIESIIIWTNERTFILDDEKKAKYYKQSGV